MTNPATERIRQPNVVGRPMALPDLSGAAGNRPDSAHNVQPYTRARERPRKPSPACVPARRHAPSPAGADSSLGLVILFWLAVAALLLILAGTGVI